jgi:hypothetical protein
VICELRYDIVRLTEELRERSLDHSHVGMISELHQTSIRTRRTSRPSAPPTSLSQSWIDAGPPTSTTVRTLDCRCARSPDALRGRQLRVGQRSVDVGIIGHSTWAAVRRDVPCSERVIARRYRVPRTALRRRGEWQCRGRLNAAHGWCDRLRS